MVKRVAVICCRLILLASLPAFALGASPHTSAQNASPQNYPAQTSLSSTQPSAPQSAPAQGSAAQSSTAQPSGAVQGQSSNPSGNWIQLFNGRDLSGWKHVGPGYMTVEDGLIHTHGGMGLLYWTVGKLSNCVLRVVFRMRDENDNSGVFIRIPVEPREEWMPVHYGYEVQIDNHPEKSNEDEYHSTGMLYSLTKPLAKAWKPGPEWNIMEITLDGPHTVVVLNGVKVTDYKEGDPVPTRKFDFEPQHGMRPLEGYIGLQNHSDNDVVFFKEVSVKPLSSAASGK